MENLRLVVMENMKEFGEKVNFHLKEMMNNSGLIYYSY